MTISFMWHAFADGFNMKQIVVADIFGRTKALEGFAGGLKGSIEIIDPYGTQVMNFRNEAEAYAHFNTEVGLRECSK